MRLSFASPKAGFRCIESFSGEVLIPAQNDTQRGLEDL